ncbi:uncharacterized protein Z518_01132 [Rhinocladiella mackenziei CBS 650.93]|uniref:CCD97-like C-terminal domain-containing protein n=1 Tax=Rhinocladiella mackenziei CBS 650.93 TaxID=1442369 RepID=A0A0D2J328_9EURO|nr:uncharacterized protein Z518_01132 [Rhinocladiella mackenziei CBS 650.93]KIX10051.1 hypothetical protein Z518_01132 [Rhinocladiella mackenziei CBS 650.93]
MADPSDRPAWSDISARLQNLRNLLSSERHLGADQQRAFEAIDREMEHQTAVDPAATRDRRRRDHETHVQEPDIPSVSENLPHSGSPSSLVRTRRRAFRPSERLQRYQRERLGQSGRTTTSETHISPSHLSPSSPAHSVSDRDDRQRSKRRKLDDGTYQDELRTFRYGHNGQVVPGHLRMDIVVCDGGEYSDSLVPIDASPQNVLRDDTSVYCTKTNSCNLLLRHVGGMPFTLTKIVIKAPRHGFDAPIQEGLIFVAMDHDMLLEKTAQYEIRWSPKSSRHQRHRQDGFRPSQEYMNSTRSPLRSIDRSRYSGNLTNPGDDPELETTLVPGFSVSVADPSDDEDIGDGQPSPPQWHDDDYSLRSYVDRYRPVYLGNERNDGLWSTSSDSEGYEPDVPSEERLPGERERFQRQQLEIENTLAHRNRMLDLMRAQQIRDSDEYFGRRSRRGEHDDEGPFNRRSTPSRIGLRTFAPAIGASDPVYPSEESLGRLADFDNTTSKSGTAEVGASSSTKADVVIPHARFFISRSKSSTAIKFDPPVSGRYVLVKLWAQCPNANIDIQAILPYGYGGPRFFPMHSFDMPRFAEGTGIPIRDNGRTIPARASAPSASQVPDWIRIKNRRKRYLDVHPEYFGPQLELADPLLYDRLIRRFQSPAEREAEGRQKGYSGILEADLYRSEAKLDALRRPDPQSMFTYKRGPNGEILAEEQDEVPANKEEGFARWRWEMEVRFLRGGDDDFDYATVDNNPEYDDRAIEEQDAEDKYFDEQEPEFVEGEDGATRSESKELEGETGIQDF